MGRPFQRRVAAIQGARFNTRAMPGRGRNSDSRRRRWRPGTRRAVIDSDASRCPVLAAAADVQSSSHGRPGPGLGPLDLEPEGPDCTNCPARAARSLQWQSAQQHALFSAGLTPFLASMSCTLRQLRTPGIAGVQLMCAAGAAPDFAQFKCNFSQVVQDSGSTGVVTGMILAMKKEVVLVSKCWPMRTTNICSSTQLRTSNKVASRLR